jgi:hypothetical protein
VHRHANFQSRAFGSDRPLPSTSERKPHHTMMGGFAIGPDNTAKVSPHGVIHL